ncbi:MAG: rRNA maturation RNase YbeY [Candidatus Terrybacteria bacterium]|nr:rRNA maturation RNase YbeY [Candidatus Terrybacteria bacterium]
MLKNYTRQRLPLAFLRRVLMGAIDELHATRAEIGVALVGERRMARLLKAHPPCRSHRSARVTNVLAFSYTRRRGAIIGDIILCVPVAEREARRFSRTRKLHLAVLLVHGMVHLAGYRHYGRREARRMESVERRILATIDFT